MLAKLELNIILVTLMFICCGTQVWENKRHLCEDVWQTTTVLWSCTRTCELDRYTFYMLAN